MATVFGLLVVKVIPSGLWGDDHCCVMTCSPLHVCIVEDVHWHCRVTFFSVSHEGLFHIKSIIITKHSKWQQTCRPFANKRDLSWLNWCKVTKMIESRLAAPKAGTFSVRDPPPKKLALSLINWRKELTSQTVRGNYGITSDRWYPVHSRCIISIHW